VSNPNPVGGTILTVTIRSDLPSAPVIVSTNYKSKSSTYTGSTDRSGNSSVGFNVGHPKVDYPIGVAVNVGNGEAICGTSFTPR
jgi:hypothetical protein